MNITNCTAESRKKCRYCDANKEHIFAVNKIFVNFVALILTVYSSFEIKTSVLARAQKCRSATNAATTRLKR